jgi:hypothetical protein
MLGQRERFVPDSHDCGQEIQVDWYRAWIDLDGGRIKAQLGARHSMADGTALHRARLHTMQQAFDDFGSVLRPLHDDARPHVACRMKGKSGAALKGKAAQ